MNSKPSKKELKGCNQKQLQNGIISISVLKRITIMLQLDQGSLIQAN